ncbi:MAG: Na+/H+ antiporter NhaA [Hyphomonadaceae bacterium]
MSAPTYPLAAWIERDTTPGLVLMLAAALSFALFNSPLAAEAHHAIDAKLIGPVSLHWIVNDGLMAMFFLYAGLELKREIMEGPFRQPATAALPFFGAMGGIAAPALIYLAVAPDFSRGWAIPAATDIAFAIGVLSLLGNRVPAGLRLFLLALAIIDDLGAILVIAVFYSSAITGWALGGAAVCFLAMLGLNRAGVRALWPYWLLAAPLWGFMLASGVHATVAGVLAAVAVPMRDKAGASPLIAAEHALKNWVQLGIMPLFALTNAGVTVSGLAAALHPVALGAGLGLFLGKPLGVLSATALAAALLRRPMPAPWAAMLGLSMIAGIGFTMSLFIGGLAFGAGPLAEPVRLGVMGGSILSALGGLLLLHGVLRGPAGVPPDAQLAADEAKAEKIGVFEADDEPA